MLEVKVTMTDGTILEYEFEDTIAEPVMIAEIEKGMIEGCKKTNLPWDGGYVDHTTGIVHPDHA